MKYKDKIKIKNLKRIRGIKNRKNNAKNIRKKFSYRITFSRKKYKKICYDYNSEEKTNYSENNDEFNKVAYKYYYKLKDIINDFSIKNNIGLENDNAIINKLNEIIHQTNKTKINIILDIDQTLVYSQLINSEDINYINNLNIDKENSHYIMFSIGDKNYLYFIQVRPGLKEFISKLSPFCNFFVNSMANPTYVRMVLILLNQKYNLILNNDESNNIFITPYNHLKALPYEITKDGNFLILDDNICAWDKTYLPNIIPVKKFYGAFIYNNENGNLFFKDKPFYQYYLYTNRIYCFNENKRKLYDKNNNLPFCCEASWSEINQLNNICDTIIKVYILKELFNMKLCYAFYNILNHILNNCNIYYKGGDENFFRDLIILLGGNYIDNINEAKYILISDNNNLDNKAYVNNKIQYIHIKWIFDTYFSFLKCDESKYKL